MSTPEPTSTIYIAPEYTKGPGFQGWYLQPTAVPIACGSSEAFFITSTYAVCYNPSTSKFLTTACDGPHIARLVGVDATVDCTGTSTCSSYYILPTEGASDSEGFVRYGCMTNLVGDSTNVDTIYRSLPARYLSILATITETTITSTESTTSPITNTDTSSMPQATTGTSSSSPAPATTITSSTPQATTGTSSSSASSSHGLSRGAIAGIVIGCIAAFAILVLLIFRKRLIALFKRNKPAIDNEPTPSPGYPPSQVQSMSQSFSTWRASELSAEDQQIYEIGSSLAGKSMTIHELG